MSQEQMTGRNFIRMMRPVLGLEGVPGIREMRITAEHNDVTIVEVDMIARPDMDKINAEPEPANETAIRTRKYTVTVTEVIE